MFKKMANSLSGRGLGRIPGSSVIRRIIARVNEALKPGGVVLIERQGSKMFVDADDEGMVPHLLVDGVYEEFETELYKKSIRPDMVIVDIGANFGYYSLIGARLLNAGGMVYAFEPEPHNYEMLLKNIEINGYSNIIPVRKAISNRGGINRLYVDRKNLGGHSLHGKHLRGSGLCGGGSGYPGWLFQGRGGG
ncbi:MAG: FkbM family methyltransferase [Actinobacteria bacterium]|nr:FkbM family methyltransferase [Actinomycetota bacterium]